MTPPTARPSVAKHLVRVGVGVRDRDRAGVRVRVRVRVRVANRTPTVYT